MSRICKGCTANRDDIEFQGFKTCQACRNRQSEIRKTDQDIKRKKLYYARNRDRVGIYGHEYRRSLQGRFKKARSAAKRAEVLFNISFEQYQEIISAPCFYCEGFFPPVTAGSGLDKMNPSEGYTVNNCVSCCDTCNTLKNDMFSPEETKAAITAIIKVKEGKCIKSQ